MRKRKPTMTEIELDRIGKRDVMASRKPKQSAMECFKRAPYTTTKKEG